MQMILKNIEQEDNSYEEYITYYIQNLEKIEKIFLNGMNSVQEYFRQKVIQLKHKISLGEFLN